MGRKYGAGRFLLLIFGISFLLTFWCCAGPSMFLRAAEMLGEHP